MTRLFGALDRNVRGIPQKEVEKLRQDRRSIPKATIGLVEERSVQGSNKKLDMFKLNHADFE